MKFLSSSTHTIIGLIVGLALLVAPNLFGFNDIDSAAMVARAVGIFILLNELITDGDISIARLVPMRVHVVLDMLTGAFLALSPLLFGFIDEETNAWLPHIIVGLLIIGYAAVTRVDSDNTTSNV